MEDNTLFPCSHAPVSNLSVQIVLMDAEIFPHMYRFYFVMLVLRRTCFVFQNTDLRVHKGAEVQSLSRYLFLKVFFQTVFASRPAERSCLRKRQYVNISFFTEKISPRLFSLSVSQISLLTDMFQVFFSVLIFGNIFFLNNVHCRYSKPAEGSFFGAKQYVKAGGTQDLSHYHIPSWADPHYSSSGNDRNFG